MKILIIVDAQWDFIDGPLSTDFSMNAYKNMLEKAEDYKDQMVIFTKDTHYSNYLETQEGKNLPVKHCEYLSGGWMIPNSFFDIVDLQKSMVLEKEGFGSMKLVETLLNYNKIKAIESIEIIGLVTDICVISNALMIKSALPEVPIIVDASCCAGTSIGAHAAALQIMKNCQVQVIN